MGNTQTTSNLGVSGSGLSGSGSGLSGSGLSGSGLSGSGLSGSGSYGTPDKYGMYGSQENAKQYVANLQKFMATMDNQLLIPNYKDNYMSIIYLQNLLGSFLLLSNNILSIDFSQQNILGQILHLLDNDMYMLIGGGTSLLSTYFVPILYREFKNATIQFKINPATAPSG